MSFGLDPEVRAALQSFTLDIACRLPDVTDLASRRRASEMKMDQLNALLPSEPQVSVERASTVSSDGELVQLYWYSSGPGTRRPAVLYLHGGGLLACGVRHFHRAIARYVAASGVPFLAVDYRLAPEHPFPTPLDDCFAALQWLHRHSEGLGVDPRRLAVMGDSAGGGLAAAVAIEARDRGGPRIARQILVYPMLDDRTVTADDELAQFATWTAADNRMAWAAYLGDNSGGAEVPPVAAPARIVDAAGLPPAYLEVGQLDLFRDECLEYARRLSVAGVDLELYVRHGVPHAYDIIAPASAVARRSQAERVRVLREL